MAVSLKRSLSLIDNNIKNNGMAATTNKKPRLSGFGPCLVLKEDGVNYSSSDDDSEDEEESRAVMNRRKNMRNSTGFNTLCSAAAAAADLNKENHIKNNKSRRQRRDKRNMQRSFGSILNNNSVSKAVAQYSDDDEDDVEEVDNKVEYEDSRSEDDSSFVATTRRLSSKPVRKISMTSPTLKSSSTFNSSCSLNQYNSIPSPPQTADLPKSRSYLPDSDFTARSRCFDYLVGAIDEAWARYCDATAYAEDEIYGYNHSNNKNTLINSYAPNTPASIAATSDEEDGYRSEISTGTNLTEYETDLDESHKHHRPSVASFMSLSNMNNNNNTTTTTTTNNNVSQAPDNVKLQELKDRLIKAKYFLQDYVDSSDVNHCLTFWKKWDLIKYSTVELVEDDDEDEIVESTIDDLEIGRFHGSF